MVKREQGRKTLKKTQEKKGGTTGWTFYLEARLQQDEVEDRVTAKNEEAYESKVVFSIED